MALIIGVVSQKGGVGKSTISRMVAVEYAKHNWNVKIADFDTQQGTSFNWNGRRLNNRFQPEVSVEMFSKVSQALKLSNVYDLMVFDGLPHSNSTTLEIAKVSTLVILPTGIALDDLEPTIKLCHELKSSGIDIQKIAVALVRVGDSETEIYEAISYINKSGYHLLTGSIPEKVSFRRMSDLGKSITETPFLTLNARAEELMASIVDRVDEIKN